MTFVARYFATAAIAASTLLFSACSSEPAPEPVKKQTNKAQATENPLPTEQAEQLGTPMAERVAVIGLLNKRTGQLRDIELKPGQDIRLGKVVLRLRACERTAPWENIPDQGAFVQMLVFERPFGTNQKERWAQKFSGWLFKENPAANVVEHPIYDIWVKECKMSFPGEEEPLDTKSKPPSSGDDENEAGKERAPAAKKPSSAPQSAPPKPKAAPVPEPEAEADEGEEQAVEEGTVET